MYCYGNGLTISETEFVFKALLLPFQLLLEFVNLSLLRIVFVFPVIHLQGETLYLWAQLSGLCLVKVKLLFKLKGFALGRLTP